MDDVYRIGVVCVSMEGGYEADGKYATGYICVWVGNSRYPDPKGFQTFFARVGFLGAGGRMKIRVVGGGREGA